MSANPSLSLDDIEYVLEESAVDLGSAGWDQYYGYGRVAADAAVALALQTSNSDRQAPTVSLTSPSSGAWVTGSISVTASATDNNGVTLVQFFADSALIATDNTTPFEIIWDTTTTADGTVAISAKAFDAAGNTATSASRDVTVANDYVDTVSPVVTISSPANNASVKKVVSITASATDNGVLSEIRVAVDGSVLCTSAEPAISCSWNTRRAADGEHIITVTALDAAGNVGQSQVIVNVGSTDSDNGGKGGGKGRNKK
jgi:hypothetical protein